MTTNCRSDRRFKSILRITIVNAVDVDDVNDENDTKEYNTWTKRRSGGSGSWGNWHRTETNSLMVEARVGNTCVAYYLRRPYGLHAAHLPASTANASASSGHWDTIVRQILHISNDSQSYFGLTLVSIPVIFE